jgi:hypothetical protein
VDRADVLPAEQQAGADVGRAELGSLAAQRLDMRAQQRQSERVEDHDPLCILSLTV